MPTHLLTKMDSSLLDELLAATGVPDTQAPSPGAAADEGVGESVPETGKHFRLVLRGKFP